MPSRTVEIIPPHPWFAWHPVRIHYAGIWKWLTIVYRRRVHVIPPLGVPVADCVIWEYHLNPPAKAEKADLRLAQEDAQRLADALLASQRELTALRELLEELEK